MNIKLKSIKTFGKRFKNGDALDLYIANIKLGWVESKVGNSGEELFKFHSTIIVDALDTKGSITTRFGPLDEIITSIELCLKEFIKKVTYADS